MHSSQDAENQSKDTVSNRDVLKRIDEKDPRFCRALARKKLA